ncbi:hypothetical protein GCM10027021_18410 [Dyella kyungheensis]
MHSARELEVRDRLDAQVFVLGAVERNRTLVEKNFSHVDYLIPSRAGVATQAPPPKPGLGSTDEQTLYQRRDRTENTRQIWFFPARTTVCVCSVMDLVYPRAVKKHLCCTRTFIPLG